MVDARQYASAKHIIAVSELVKAHILELYRVPADSIDVIYNGVDLRHFDLPEDPGARRALRARWCQDEATVFVQVAHNFELKGVDYALRALQRVLRTGAQAQLLVIGGDNVEPYRALASRLGIDRQTHFIGPVDDVRPYYHAADICLHPALYDACSLTILEALACGLPVISSRYNGAAELIEPGGNGFVLAEPRDVAAMAEVMLHVCDPRLRADLATRTHIHATQFDQEHNFTKILELYDRVLQQRDA